MLNLISPLPSLLNQRSPWNGPKELRSVFCSLNQRYLYVACLAGEDITHRNLLVALN